MMTWEWSNWYILIPAFILWYMVETSPKGGKTPEQLFDEDPDNKPYDEDKDY